VLLVQPGGDALLAEHMATTQLNRRLIISTADAAHRLIAHLRSAGRRTKRTQSKRVSTTRQAALSGTNGEVQLADDIGHCKNEIDNGDHHRRAITGAGVSVGGGEESLSIEEDVKIKGSQRFAIMQKLARPEGKIVCVHNMIGSDGIDDEFEADITEEVSRYGQLRQVIVHPLPVAGQSKEKCKVYLIYADVQSAATANEKLNGRWFAGVSLRSEVVQSLPAGARPRVKQSSPPSIDDSATQQQQQSPTTTSAEK